jgi:hypothetical protein
LVLALVAVALTMSGLLVGYQPVSGDPDCLYRPIKAELASALISGTLPFWSDHFGLGVPLVAESHAAAFYPLNWISYRVLSVSSAYRLGMWLHYLALVVAMYGYARVLRLGPWGSGLAAVALSLCGFQMSHSCHEPFYHLLPYLPISLLLAERFLAEGQLVLLALLALALGAQFTLGHFQIQAWTAGLVILTGLWRSAFDKKSWLRAGGLMIAVGWAFAVASVQLLLTRDLIRASNFDRSIEFLTLFSFPPSHFAQAALPGLFSAFDNGTKSHYWATQRTSADEACLYIGTIPLILACCGLLARRDKALALWKWLIVVGLALSSMDYWWPEGLRLLLRLPVLGHFRAPGRYTLLTSIGLCLLAGRGFDHALSRKRFWSGYGLAIVVGVTAIGWGAYWSSQHGVVEYLSPERAARFLLVGGVVWTVSLGVVCLWRLKKLPDWVPLILTACELGYLYHHGTTPWGWPIPFPETSAVFQTLRAEKGVELVAGDLQDLPIRAGLTAAYPNLGIVAPPPNYLLEQYRDPSTKADCWLRSQRWGVTHGVYEGPLPFRPSEVLYLGTDATLDAILTGKPETRYPRLWRVERYADTFPAIRCATKEHVVENWYKLYPELSKRLDPGEVLRLAEDKPPGPEPAGPRGTNAHVLHWEGVTGEVEHDGWFDLVIRRTYVPGWTASLNQGPEIPVSRVEGGLQSFRIPGSGVTRIQMRYRPPSLRTGLMISIAATGLAALVILVEAVRAVRRSRRQSQTVATPEPLSTTTQPKPEPAGRLLGDE